MHWLTGAAVNLGIVAAYVAFMWGAFALLDQALIRIDRRRHR